MLEIAEAERNGAPVIFAGTVERLEGKEGEWFWPGHIGIHAIATLRVSAAYRGVDQKVVTVVTGLGGGDCGVPFRAGEEYLVYARKGEAESLVTDICMGTGLLELKATSQRLLRGEPPAPEDLLDESAYFRRLDLPMTGKICGKITLPNGEEVANGMLWAWDVNRVFAFPDGSRIGMARFRAKIQPDGSYCTNPVPRGKYWVGAEAGPLYHESAAHFEGFFSSADSVEQAIPVEVQPGARTTGIDFALQSVTRAKVGLRVLGADGNPTHLRGLEAELVIQDGKWLSQQGSPYSNQAVLGHDGTAEFWCLSPGRYRLFLASLSGLIEGATRDITLAGQDMEVEVVLPVEKRD
jgi:hypothetical protein